LVIYLILVIAILTAEKEFGGEGIPNVPIEGIFVGIDKFEPGYR